MMVELQIQNLQGKSAGWKFRLSVFSLGSELHGAAGLKLRQGLYAAVWRRIPSLMGNQSLLLRPSTDWTRPIHIKEGNLLYSKSTNLNVCNLNVFKVCKTYFLNNIQTVRSNNWAYSLAELTHKIRHNCQAKVSVTASTIGHCLSLWWRERILTLALHIFSQNRHISLLLTFQLQASHKTMFTFNEVRKLQAYHEQKQNIQDQP